MNHNPSPKNLFSTLWTATIIGICAWSASPVVVHAQGESLSPSPCVSDVDQWKLPATKKKDGGGDTGGKYRKSDGGGDTGGKGNRKFDGGGETGGKAKLLNVTRNVSVPLGASRERAVITRASTLKAPNGQVISQQILANNVLTQKTTCEYTDQDTTILVSERTWNKSSQRETVALISIDRETRNVSYLDEDRDAHAELRYDAAVAPTLTPESFEAKIYSWATTRDVNRAADAQVDKQKRYFRTADDEKNDRPGRPFFETMVLYDSYGRISRVEMCFAESWAECFPKPAEKWVTYIKPLKKRSRGSSSIAIWTDKVTPNPTGGNSRHDRLRSEVLVLQTGTAKLPISE